MQHASTETIQYGWLETILIIFAWPNVVWGVMPKHYEPHISIHKHMHIHTRANKCKCTKTFFVYEKFLYSQWMDWPNPISIMHIWSDEIDENCSEWNGSVSVCLCCVLYRCASRYIWIVIDTCRVCCWIKWKWMHEKHRKQHIFTHTLTHTLIKQAHRCTGKNLF